MPKHFFQNLIHPVKVKQQPHVEYQRLHCHLVSYDFPKLATCYILCHEASNSKFISTDALLAFAEQEAQRLSLIHTNSTQNFILAISGADIRKSANWHIHIFIARNRLQKAYVYQILAIKNFILTLNPYLR